MNKLVGFGAALLLLSGCAVSSPEPSAPSASTAARPAALAAVAESHTSVPQVRDLANDARGQLFTTVGSSDDVGQELTVWRAHGPRGPFVRAGGLTGYLDRITAVDDSYNVIYASAPLASGVYTVFRLVDDRVVELIRLPVAPATPSMDRGWTQSWITSGNTACLLKIPTDEEVRALTDAGWLSGPDGDRILVQQLCQTSWVRNTYPA